jgi:hypothetical protein
MMPIKPKRLSSTMLEWVKSNKILSLFQVYKPCKMTSP